MTENTSLYIIFPASRYDPLQRLSKVLMVMMSFLKSLFSVSNDAGQFGSDQEVVEGGKPYKAAADGVFDVGALPAELLLYILSWVPAVDLVKICSQVCKQWCEISRSTSLWKIKCLRERKYIPHLMGPPPEDFMKFYFLSPYTQNLLHNDRALGKWCLFVDWGF